MKYSQNNEEEIIDRYFGEHVGRFLDIGAFDGEDMSNTRALALRGWSGVIVEASPWIFPKLYERYRDNDKITLINAAVGSGACRLAPFYPDLTERQYGSTLSTRWAECSHINNPKPYLVQVLGIQELLDREACGLDFVTIDTEGMDLEILKAAEWQGVKLLSVEYTTDPNAPWEVILREKGFSIYSRTATNIYGARAV